MLLSFIKNIPIIKQIYLKLGQKWITNKLQTVLSHLDINNKILDVGSGNGAICNYLKTKGYNIDALDVANLSIYPHIKTVVYDGKKMPFKNKAYGTALLLTVLHHTNNPKIVLKETARVSQKIIIIEDIYSNIIQQYMTYIMDTLVNLGHSNMTYQNKNDKEWKILFKQLNLQLVHEHKRRVLLFFTQKTYVLVH